jgi:hypothetical protein
MGGPLKLRTILGAPNRVKVLNKKLKIEKKKLENPRSHFVYKGLEIPSLQLTTSSFTIHKWGIVQFSLSLFPNFPIPSLFTINPLFLRNMHSYLVSSSIFTKN